MQSATYTESGECQQSSLTSVAIEGPSWTRADVLFEFLSRMLAKHYGWSYATLPWCSTAANDLCRYARFIESGPVVKTIYRHHVLPMVAACLDEGEDEVTPEPVAFLLPTLFVIPRPGSSGPNRNHLTEKTGFSSALIDATIDRYVYAAEKASLNYIEVVTNHMGGPAWKLRAFKKIMERLGLKRNGA